MSKIYISIIILILISGTGAAVIIKTKSPSNVAPSLKISPPPVSIEKINKLIAQAENYEAKFKITSSNNTAYGYMYVTPSKIEINYQTKNEKIFSVSDLNKNEIINYSLNNKKGVRMPGQVGINEALFKKLPNESKFAGTGEIINGVDCWVIKIEQKNTTKTLWISKEDGIVIKEENITLEGTTTFEITGGITKNEQIKIEIPAEIEIIDLTSEEFVTFVQENPDSPIIILPPSLPLISIEPVISPLNPNIQEPTATSSETTLPVNIPSSFPSEGIYEETNPRIPFESKTIY